MVSGWVQSLTEEIRPDRGPRYRVSWVRAERAVGLALPADYKDLVEWFGPGYFNDFVLVTVPGVANPHMELASWVKGGLTIQSALISDDIIPWPYPRHPSPGFLLPWGNTADGDFLYWQTNGEPDRWTVVAQPGRGEDFFHYEGGMAEFLVRYLRGEIQLPFSEEPLPSRSFFVPWTGEWDGPDGLDPYGVVVETAD